MFGLVKPPYYVNLFNSQKKKLIVHEFISKDGVSKEQINMEFTRLSKMYSAQKGKKFADFKIYANIKYDSGITGRKNDYRTVSAMAGDEIEVHHYGTDKTSWSDPELNTAQADAMDKAQIKAFSFQVHPISKHGGCVGNQTQNDCLFYALKDHYEKVKKTTLPVGFGRPFLLKKVLGLGRADKVPVDKLKELSDHLQASIYLFGEQRKQIGQYEEVIKLHLQNDHYRIYTSRNKANNIQMKGISYKDKNKENVVVYDLETFKTYDPINGFQENNEEFVLKQRANPLTSNYIVIPNIDVKIFGTKDLKETYDLFVKTADELKLKTKNGLNMYKCPRVDTLMMAHFAIRNTDQTRFDDIDETEAPYLKVAGGLLYCNKGSYNNCFKYDCRSAYPARLVGDELEIPITKPEYRIIDEFKNEYGIYRAVVNQSKNHNTNNLFKFRKDNLYTHFDLESATLLNLKFELIQDGEVNFIHYQNTMKTSQLFTAYITPLYKLKNDSTLSQPAKNIVKMLLSSIWGKLCEHNILTIDNTANVDYEYELISSTRDYETNVITNRISPSNRQFITNYARIGPFITSLQRLEMVRTFLPHKKDIVYIATDGVITLKAIDLDFGLGIGQWKQDQSNVNITINNCRDIQENK